MNYSKNTVIICLVFSYSYQQVDIKKRSSTNQQPQTSSWTYE